MQDDPYYPDLYLVFKEFLGYIKYDQDVYYYD